MKSIHFLNWMIPSKSTRWEKNQWNVIFAWFKFRLQEIEMFFFPIMNHANFDYQLAWLGTIDKKINYKLITFFDKITSKIQVQNVVAW